MLAFWRSSSSLLPRPSPLVALLPPQSTSSSSGSSSIFACIVPSMPPRLPILHHLTPPALSLLPFPPPFHPSIPAPIFSPLKSHHSLYHPPHSLPSQTHRRCAKYPTPCPTTPSPSPKTPSLSPPTAWMTAHPHGTPAPASLMLCPGSYWQISRRPGAHLREGCRSRVVRWVGRCVGAAVVRGRARRMRLRCIVGGWKMEEDWRALNDLV